MLPPPIGGGGGGIGIGGVAVQLSKDGGFDGFVSAPMLPKKTYVTRAIKIVQLEQAPN